MANNLVRTVLLDTNVLIDYIDISRPEHANAVAAVHLAASMGIRMIAPTGSYKDAYYILRRVLKSEPTARKLISHLIDADYIKPVDLKARYLRPALAPNEPDFEDGLIRQTAESEAADLILTRDMNAFDTSPVRPMSPLAFTKEFVNLSTRNGL